MIADNIFQESSPAAAGTVLTANGSFARPSFQAPSTITLGCTALTGATDALPLLGSVFVNSTGVDAMTLATPTVGGPGTGNDGQLLEVFDTGGHAHTITVADEIFEGVNDLLTFSGTVGSYVRLRAYNGKWWIVGSSGVTASDPA